MVIQIQQMFPPSPCAGRWRAHSAHKRTGTNTMGRDDVLSQIISAQYDLELKLNEETDEDKRNHLILQHIEAFNAERSFIFPEFKKDFQWLNTSRPLTLCKDFIGKIAILDFFTYCCINCMHILPDLEFIENEYPPQIGVIVVGVHSAKFENEKSLENVASAIVRYNINHPVVNDPCGYLWSKLSVACWPTLIVLGPCAQVLFVVVGEGKRNLMQSLIDCCLKFYTLKNQLSIRSLPLQLLCSNKPNSPLLFPGKVACCTVDTRLAVSDTGHHRILILSEEGLVQNVIGGLSAGFADGTFEKAKFHSPQGITWKSSNVLFVADTENHAIRQICLTSKRVTTIAGNGHQGNDCEGGRQGTEQPINSPWDLCIGEWNSDGSGRDVLLIAMAGAHQIWSYALEESTLLSGKTLEKGSCSKMVGSGKEENRNNRYPSKASFAQPSGICIAKSASGEARLIVADSESSTIRMIDFQTWAVQGIVGGGRDPTDLFQFGDTDGIGIDAKLQHPLGVCWSSNKKALYVADSYNHKIKLVDLLTKKCESYAGIGISGNSCGNVSDGTVMFNEPGGISISSNEKILYIADTNNHSVKVADVLNGTVTELPIIFIDNAAVSLEVKNEDIPDLPSQKLHKHKPHAVVSVEPISVASDVSIAIIVTFTLASGLKMNMDGPSMWNLQLLGNDEFTGLKCSGKINPTNRTVDCKMHVPPTAFDTGIPHSLVLECTLYICDSKGLCYMRIIAFQADVVHSLNSYDVERQIDYSLNID